MKRAARSGGGWGAGGCAGLGMRLTAGGAKRQAWGWARLPAGLEEKGELIEGGPWGAAGDRPRAGLGFGRGEGLDIWGEQGRELRGTGWTEGGRAWWGLDWRRMGLAEAGRSGPREYDWWGPGFQKGLGAPRGRDAQPQPSRFFTGPPALLRLSRNRGYQHQAGAVHWPGCGASPGHHHQDRQSDPGGCWDPLPPSLPRP